MKTSMFGKRRVKMDATVLHPRIEANDFECCECTPLPLWERALSALAVFRPFACVGVGPVTRRSIPMVAIRLRADLANCLLDQDEWGWLQPILLDWESRLVADGIGLYVEIARTLSVTGTTLTTHRAMEIRLVGKKRDAQSSQASWDWFLKVCRWIHALDADCQPLLGGTAAVQ
ncbi:MAG TPA: hypothetical protein PLU72_20040 [Candidatus Ozemobacteraceae bacterium]|nr:hypothetical protein [Candidatus Ozemobacteraceae bacterium]